MRALNIIVMDIKMQAIYNIHFVGVNILEDYGSEDPTLLEYVNALFFLLLLDF